MFSVLKYFSESNFGENCEGCFSAAERHLSIIKDANATWRTGGFLTVNLNLRIDTRHPLAAICVSLSVS